MKKYLSKNQVFEILFNNSFKHLFNYSMFFFNIASFDVKILKTLLNSVNLKFSYYVNYIGTSKEFQNYVVTESKNKSGLIVLISFSEFSDLIKFGFSFEKFLFELSCNNNVAGIVQDFNLLFSTVLTKFNGEFFGYCVNSILFSKAEFSKLYSLVNQNSEISEVIMIKNKLISNIINDINSAIFNIF